MGRLRELLQRSANKRIFNMQRKFTRGARGEERQKAVKEARAKRSPSRENLGGLSLIAGRLSGFHKAREKSSLGRLSDDWDAKRYRSMGESAKTTRRELEK